MDTKFTIKKIKYVVSSTRKTRHNLDLLDTLIEFPCEKAAHIFCLIQQYDQTFTLLDAVLKSQLNYCPFI